MAVFWVVAPCSLVEQQEISFVNNYKEKLIQHVHQMERSRIPRAILNYQPSGKRSQGRPLKRLLDL
jgi:hypothetical protein